MEAASPYSTSDASWTHARRLFALSRMVEVLLYNLARLHDFWPLLLDHVVELLSVTRAPARLAAIDALNRALIGALAARLQMNAQACNDLLPAVTVRMADMLETCWK